jgi:hypothetical protein
MKLDRILKPLEILFSETGVNWVLELHHILTEPTCPTAIITPERWEISRYRFDCDNIEESLRTCVALVVKEVIKREVVGHGPPYTTPDDAAYEKWLLARAAGSNAHLGSQPAQGLPPDFEATLDTYLEKEDIDKLVGKGISYASAYIAARLGYANYRIRHGEVCKMIEAKLKVRAG